MKPYVITNAEGKELGRLLARSQEEAEEAAARMFTRHGELRVEEWRP